MSAASNKAAATALATRVSRQLTLAGHLSNGIGGVLVFSFLGFFVPGNIDSDEYTSLAIRNSAVFIPYLVITLPLGRWWVMRQGFHELADWLLSGRPPTGRERLLALRYPARWVPRAAAIWVSGTVLMCLLNIDTGATFVTAIAVTSLLGAVTSCALQYLLAERAMRPIVALALSGGRPPEGATPGVAARISMAWALGTGVPLLGIGALAVVELLGDGLSDERLAGAALVLTLVGLTVGFLALRVAGRSVAEPLINLRDAVATVESGDLTAHVTVDDGSEVGLLQAGFNGMVSGLRERERLREAFGMYVDPRLTERVLEEGVDLAGEEVELSLFFLDVRDFTTFAEGAPATRVVSRLNELFEVVVPLVFSHGGHANKFIGDGLLAIFGAPERFPDHADRAVACACEVAAAVRQRFGDSLRVGIGVNTGLAVVGTIGGGGRLEFTVIGDAVNTAARVEACTRETGDDLLITEMTLAQLRSTTDEWEPRPAIPLKGKSEPVLLYAPVPGVGVGQPASAKIADHGAG